jgi:hypothetical protein
VKTNEYLFSYNDKEDFPLSSSSQRRKGPRRYELWSGHPPPSTSSSLQSSREFSPSRHRQGRQQQQRKVIFGRSTSPENDYLSHSLPQSHSSTQSLTHSLSISSALLHSRERESDDQFAEETKRRDQDQEKNHSRRVTRTQDQRKKPIKSKAADVEDDLNNDLSSHPTSPLKRQTQSQKATTSMSPQRMRSRSRSQSQSRKTLVTPQQSTFSDQDIESYENEKRSWKELQFPNKRSSSSSREGRYYKPPKPAHHPVTVHHPRAWGSGDGLRNVDKIKESDALPLQLTQEKRKPRAVSASRSLSDERRRGSRVQEREREEVEKIKDSMEITSDHDASPSSIGSERRSNRARVEEMRERGRGSGEREERASVAAGASTNLQEPPQEKALKAEERRFSSPSVLSSASRHLEKWREEMKIFKGKYKDRDFLHILSTRVSVRKSSIALSFSSLFPFSSFLEFGTQPKGDHLRAQ